MNWYLLIILTISNLFLCGLIFFHWHNSTNLPKEKTNKNNTVKTSQFCILPVAKTEENNLKPKTVILEKPKKAKKVLPAKINTEPKEESLESNEALENLSAQYHESLNLSKQETKILLKSILKTKSKNPCLAWQMQGDILEKCKAESINEAGIYAINAKLIPCKEQSPENNSQTYLNCYKNN